MTTFTLVQAFVIYGFEYNDIDVISYYEPRMRQNYIEVYQVSTNTLLALCTYDTLNNIAIQKTDYPELFI